MSQRCPCVREQRGVDAAATDTDAGGTGAKEGRATQRNRRKVPQSFHHRKGLIEKAPRSESLKEGKTGTRQISGGRGFQAKGTASAKVLG